jgi:MFS family permease
LIAAAFMLGFMIIGSLLADIINRRAILLIAAVVFLLFAIPYFFLINTGSFILATIAEIIGFGFVFGLGYGANGELSDPLPRLGRKFRLSNLASIWRRFDSDCCRFDLAHR